MELVDIIIFIFSFSKEKINHFREEFLQQYVSTDEYYESPKYSSPVLFETEFFLEMWNYVLEEKGRSYTFYFENKKNKSCPKGAIQTNLDGSICLVLSVDFNYLKKYETKLMISFPEDNCIISYSYFMPFSIKDFNEQYPKRT